MTNTGSIGVFDSGFGGLTVLRSLVKALPEYNFLYLGDNARSPYGTRSYETVYQYTLSGVKYLFDKGCPLVILACNTASAKALRTIQQRDLPHLDSSRRVLGVIRPTSEMIGNVSRNGHIGLFATSGTVISGSYQIEINKFFPELKLVQEACPMWVPLIENGEIDNEGTHYFVKQNVSNLLEADPKIDTILLACTHYPVLADVIQKYLPQDIQLISQGDIVAKSLVDYLTRHPEIKNRINKNKRVVYQTTDSAQAFEKLSKLFLGKQIHAEQVHL